jgi:hypothetical protein
VIKESKILPDEERKKSDTKRNRKVSEVSPVRSKESTAKRDKDK